MAKCITYVLIIAVTIIVCGNPLTYALIAATNDWWDRRLSEASLLALDGYLALIVVAGALWHRKRRTTTLFIVIALSLGVVPYLFAVELLLNDYKFNVARKAYLAQPKSRTFEVDPELVWRLRAATVSNEPDSKFNSVEYRIDDEGRRAIPVAQRPDFRMFFFGDSFLFGQGVRVEDTALHILATKYGNRVGVFNYAVPAYGLEQMYASLLRHASQIRPGDVVVFAPISRDLQRNLIWRDHQCLQYFILERTDRYEAFPTFGPNGLTPEKFSDACSFTRDYLLARSPLMFGRLYAAYRDWRYRGALVKNADAVFAAAKDRAEKRGARFAVIFLASADECAARRHDVDIAGVGTAHATLIDQCPATPEAIRSLAFRGDAHWSVAGNLWGADALSQTLASLGVTPPAR